MKLLRHSPAGRRQQGAVLLFALIALVVLLIGGVVMVRSMQTTLFGAGNYGFKRDLVNQSERAVQSVYDAFSDGALKDALTRETSLKSSNYSASLLTTTTHGIPEALLDDSKFAAVGTTSNDIKVDKLGVSIRYLVDRMCIAGHAGPANETNCSMSGTRIDGSSANEQINAARGSAGGAGATPLQPIYRITVRVTGPRGTESFFQTTFAN